MVIKFIGEYKSLKSFESDTLNDFSVITGKNGSGKSQLVEILNLSRATNQQPPTFESISLTPPPSNIQIEGLLKENLTALDSSAWKNRVKPHWQTYLSIGINSRKLAKVLIDAEIWVERESVQSFLLNLRMHGIFRDTFEPLIASSVQEFDPNYFKKEKEFAKLVHRLISRQYLTPLHQASMIANYVAEYRQKEFHELQESDYYLSPIPERLLERPSLFGSQIEFIFYDYARRRDLNRRHYFDKIEDGEQNYSISDEQFIDKFPPPWEIMNNILALHNIGFKFTGIEKKDFSPDSAINFHLIKTKTGKTVQFQDLSSGEKVILGLLTKLFTSEFYLEKLKFPGLLILDEPDAHLHPEMSKLLIDVLNKTFVKKLGVKVIVLTHSPSTVALCPDGSIYQIKNEPRTTLKRIEKEEAMSLLTEHLPTLSIDYKNHKQVFVESPTDVKYYQTIFDGLNRERKYPNRLGRPPNYPDLILDYKV